MVSINGKITSSVGFVFERAGVRAYTWGQTKKRTQQHESSFNQKHSKENKMSDEEPPKETIEATEATEEDAPVKEEESTATFEPVVRFKSHTSTPNTFLLLRVPP